jgi:hypothetical protein
VLRQLAQSRRVIFRIEFSAWEQLFSIWFLVAATLGILSRWVRRPHNEKQKRDIALKMLAISAIVLLGSLITITLVADDPTIFPPVIRLRPQAQGLRTVLSKTFVGRKLFAFATAIVHPAAPSLAVMPKALGLVVILGITASVLFWFFHGGLLLLHFFNLHLVEEDGRRVRRAGRAATMMWAIMSIAMFPFEAIARFRQLVQDGPVWSAPSIADWVQGVRVAEQSR